METCMHFIIATTPYVMMLSRKANDPWQGQWLPEPTLQIYRHRGPGGTWKQ